jgi:two-component system, LytTR family, response regulator
MFSLAIIDDEPKARETIVNILALSAESLTIVGEADSVESGYELIVNQKPDLVLLDIHLLDGTGFDLIRKFQKIPFRVIFITAHEEHALTAFKFSALDYILKPINATELLKAVGKAGDMKQKDLLELKFSAFLSNLDKVRKIVVRTAESIHLLQVKNIIRCEADVNYTTLFLENGEKLLVSRTLKDFAEMLEPAGFFRTHQSHLVNLDHISRFDKSEGGHLVMIDESIVPVSSRKRDQLFKVFERM